MSVNGNPVSDPKSVTVGAAGDVVRLDVFAQVSGVNGIKDERAFWTVGEFISTEGIKGNLAAAVVAPFNAPGSRGGAILDLDGDSDLDVGSLPGTYVLDTGFSAKAAAGVETTTVIDANTSEIKIAEVTFTVSNVDAGPTAIEFLPISNPNGTPFYSGAFWFEDGATSFTQVKNALNSTLAVGSPVIVAVPELTSSAGVATAAASVGLLRRRRRC